MMAYGEKRLTQQEFEKLFQETDYDQDGLINFDDFVRMMMSKWWLTQTSTLHKWWTETIQTL